MADLNEIMAIVFLEWLRSKGLWPGMPAIYRYHDSFLIDSTDRPPIGAEVTIIFEIPRHGVKVLHEGKTYNVSIDALRPVHPLILLAREAPDG